MIEINVAVSNRHVHLSRDIVDILFGKDYELTERNRLSQKSDFAANEVVTLKTNKNMIEEVRVVGPIRNYTQVEIAKSDAIFLGLNPPIRDSGDLKNSESITLIGPIGQITLDNVCIIACNHIHANNDELTDYKHNDVVSVKTKDGIIIKNVHIKKHEQFTMEMHIDKDNSSKYNLVDGDKVILEKSD